MRRAAGIGVLVALLGGCFSPSYPAELPCSSDDSWCPSGQACVAGLCVDLSVPPPDAAPVDATPPDASLGQLLAISIGDDIALPLGATHQLVVVATYENGTTDIDSGVSWVTSDNLIATVDFNGLIEARSEGGAEITASFNGRVDKAAVTVTPATFLEVRIAPAEINLLLDTSLALQAFAVYTDSATDVTAAATFASAAPLVVSLAGSTASAAGAGSTTITATWNSVPATAAATVTAATLTRIDIAPNPAPSLLVNSTTQFTAVGTFSDATSFDVTKLVTWSSDNPSVVTISNATGSQGRAVAQDSGSVTIGATLKGVMATPLTQVVF